MGKNFIRKFNNIAAIPLVVLIQIYRFVISPLLPRSCRFYPSCSAYAVEALRRFGLITGLYLTIHRLVRCNPFNDGGFDPVPNCHHK